MAAYVIADFEILDWEGMKAYAKQVGATIEQYGGKYLIQGATTETLEGDWHPHRLVILEFESVEQAKRWYHSEEYSAIKPIRHKTARTQLIVVRGIAKNTQERGSSPSVFCSRGSGMIGSLALHEHDLSKRPH
jgi:uncharacterized protein (DUF1330 family)